MPEIQGFTANEDVRALVNEALGEQRQNLEVLLESSVADIAQHLLDKQTRGWSVLMGEDPSKLTREDLGRIISETRAMTIGNPLVQRAVELMVLYPFGNGLEIDTVNPDDKDELEEFLSDRGNERALFSSEGYEYASREIDATGNLFVLLNRQKDATSVPQVRIIPVEEIKQIITQSDDRTNPVWFRRERKINGERKQEWVKSWSAPEDVDLPRGKIAEAEDVLMIHYRIGGFGHWEWGFPKLLATSDWATAYRKFLSDLAMVMSALSRYANRLSMKGSPQQLKTAQVALQSSRVNGTSSLDETNPPPAAGSTFLQGEGVKFEAFKASGMHVDADSGRRFLLMFAAGMGLPETFFADLSNSNLATAKALDRPTELLFIHRQALWSKIIKDVCGWGLSEMKGEARTGIVDASVDNISVTWGPILEHDISDIAAGLVAVLTLNLSPMFKGAEKPIAQKILQDSGFDNIEQIIEMLFDDDGNMLNAEPAEGEPNPFPAEESRLRESIKRTIVALRQAA